MIATIPTPSAQAISPVDAIWAIIQSQSKDVRQAIFLKIEEEQKRNKETGKDVLQQLNELEEGPAGFLKLDCILPPSRMSVEELREDAYTEKYGI